MDRSDGDLLRAFAAGETAALGQLAQRYERGLLGLACGLLHGRNELAKEAVQEAWLRVIRFARGFAGSERSENVAVSDRRQPVPHARSKRRADSR